MSKLLLLAIVVAVVWWLAKGFRRQGGSKRARQAAPPERMVRCSHCGLYLPLGEAVRDGERYFCSAEHRRLAG